MDAVELCRSCGWSLAGLALALFSALLCAAWLHQRRLALAQEAERTKRFERERRARQMHDTLLQGMHGLILRLQAVTDRLASDDPTRGGMDAALLRADQVLNDARDRVLALRQGDEPAGRLARALDEAGRELAGDDSAQFRLLIDGAERELRPEVHEELHQMLGEALLNAFRHAQARHIVLRLHYGRWTWWASVVDDGVGMAPELLEHGRTGHWGLSGMRERAACINAAFTMCSRPDQGTTVHVQLPARLAYASA